MQLNYDIYYSFSYKVDNKGEVEIDKVTLSDILKLVDNPYLLKIMRGVNTALS
ncbi:hypothetical protein [Acidianus sp. HS-5]|uniref:hypothetical protein n=1 Tax=Acidianus sp. HS-5 TaxID=2886040 RepID=UPI001F2EF923|nr:hypothetical protein [Acidianus sp. HS-5]BDC18530.1 hypothetical protein HS5_14200 [Acidianus sp. HS-5]